MIVILILVWSLTERKILIFVWPPKNQTIQESASLFFKKLKKYN